MNCRNIAAVSLLFAVIAMTVGCGSSESAAPVSTSASASNTSEPGGAAVPDMTAALGAKRNSDAAEAPPPAQDRSQRTSHAGSSASPSAPQRPGHGGPQRSGHGASQRPGHGGPADDSADDSASTDADEEERQVAVAGVGKKGSRYGGGIISEPVSQYFGARQRITFISVQKAMRTFEAMHERLPETHEEFMKEIIEENGLELPSLYADERYEYDPEAGELMVVRPKKK